MSQNSKEKLSVCGPIIIKKDRRFKNGNTKRLDNTIRGDFDIPKRMRIPANYAHVGIALNPPIVVDDNLAKALLKEKW